MKMKNNHILLAITFICVAFFMRPAFAEKIHTTLEINYENTIIESTHTTEETTDSTIEKIIPDTILTDEEKTKQKYSTENTTSSNYSESTVDNTTEIHTDLNNRENTTSASIIETEIKTGEDVLSGHITENSIEQKEKHNPINIYIRIEGPDYTITNERISVPYNCDIVDSTGATTTLEGYVAICALNEALHDKKIDSYQVTNWGFAFALDSINGIYNAFDWSESWILRVNNALSDVGIDQTKLDKDDELLFTYGSWDMDPLMITINTTTAKIDETLIITPYIWNDNNATFEVISSGHIIFHIGTTTSTATSTLLWKITEENQNNIWIEMKEKTRSTPASINIFPKNEKLQVETKNDEGGGSSPSYQHTSVNKAVIKIISFLDANQNNDGSFGTSASFSDWVALAYSAYGESSNAKDRLIAYLLTDKNPVDGPNKTTAYARHAMALMSLNINPYTDTKTDYISALLNEFDGRQFGDAELINDDIFALIPLLKAGYSSSDDIIINTTKTILGRQNNNGSFGSIDLTGATMQVLSPLIDINGVMEAISKAEAYLKKNQNTNGGFGDIYGTPWVAQGLIAHGIDTDLLSKNGNTPNIYIMANQNIEGSIGSISDSLNNRIWASAYAIPALLKKTWNSLLYSFSRPIIPLYAGACDDSCGQTTTTLFISTTTPKIAIETNTTSTENIMLEKITSTSTSEITDISASNAYDTKKLEIQYTNYDRLDESKYIAPKIAGIKIKQEKEILTTETKTYPENTNTTEDEIHQEIPKLKERISSKDKAFRFSLSIVIILAISLGLRFSQRLI